MDIATLLGLIGGIIVIFAAIITGSDLAIFINLPGLMIVIGGTIAATLIKFPLTHCLSAVRVAFKAFRDEIDNPIDLIRQANELAAVTRKSGILALDGHPISNEFLARGIQLAVDGLPPEFVRKTLREDMEQSMERHEIGQRIFRAIGESAPAFGMIGTLVGLVQMLANLQDPSSIGPAMAVALLTTLYGALIANLIALPIADKLELRGLQERVNKLLMIESMSAIQQGQNPRLMDEVLEAYLPHQQREKLATLLAGRGQETDGSPPS